MHTLCTRTHARTHTHAHTHTHTQTHMYTQHLLLKIISLSGFLYPDICSVISVIILILAVDRSIERECTHNMDTLHTHTHTHTCTRTRTRTHTHTHTHTHTYPDILTTKTKDSHKHRQIRTRVLQKRTKQSQMASHHITPGAPSPCSYKRNELSGCSQLF